MEAHGSAREAGADGVEGVEGDEAPGASRLEGKDWLSGKTVLEKEVVPWPRRIWSASLGISVSPPRGNSGATSFGEVAMAEIAVTVERISVAMEELPFRLLQTKNPTCNDTHMGATH